MGSAGVFVGVPGTGLSSQTPLASEQERNERFLLALTSMISSTDSAATVPVPPATLGAAKDDERAGRKTRQDLLCAYLRQAARGDVNSDAAALLQLVSDGYYSAERACGNAAAARLTLVADLRATDMWELAADAERGTYDH